MHVVVRGVCDSVCFEQTHLRDANTNELHTLTVWFSTLCLEK